ncbi:hypothetical protein T492DRAFT_1145323 [Pavlovales sp. CCMP2436]|nr:hypothetical protein T492DRAFT_1145323 [Pavlovales sp. CCMP2436]
MLSGLGRLIVLGGVSFCPGPRPAITRRVLSTAASSTRAAAAAAAGEASAKPSASAGRDEYLIHLKDPGNESSMLNHLIGQRVTRSSSVAGKTRTIDWIGGGGGIGENLNLQSGPEVTTLVSIPFLGIYGFEPAII